MAVSMRRWLLVVGVFVTTIAVFSHTSVSARAAISPAAFVFTFDDLGNSTFPNTGTGSATLTPAAACPDDPCNATTAFGLDSNYGSYWEWTSTTPHGGGFTVDTSGVIGSSYSIAMTFSIADISGYRKLIDYVNRTSDTGFYLYSGALNFYPGGYGTNVFQSNDLINLVAVRDAVTNPSSPTFTVYVSGAGGQYVQEYSYVDSSNYGVPFVQSGNTHLGFFYDDTATSSEATTAGRIYDLRMWPNTVLTAQDLPDVYSAAIAMPQPPQAPAAVSAPQLPDTGFSGGAEIFGMAVVFLIVGSAGVVRGVRRRRA